MEDVTNVLNAASSILSQKSATTSTNKKNASKVTTTRARRGPKPLPRDPVTGAIRTPDSVGNLIVKTPKYTKKLRKYSINLKFFY